MWKPWVGKCKSYSHIFIQPSRASCHEISHGTFYLIHFLVGICECPPTYSARYSQMITYLVLARLNINSGNLWELVYQRDYAVLNPVHRSYQYTNQILSNTLSDSALIIPFFLKNKVLVQFNEDIKKWNHRKKFKFYVSVMEWSSMKKNFT